MAGRTIAIGDIHGCRDALAALLDAIKPNPEDTVVILGDTIDRGPDSRGVLSLLLALSGRCRLVPILGDHEEMLTDALRDRAALRKWLSCGGTETLRSYGWTSGGPRRALADWIPQSHQKIIASCHPFHETASHLFLHAGFIPDLPMNQQPALALRWRVTDPQSVAPHCSGKIAIVGHTAQLSGEILDLGFLVCIDTNCARGGWLTAFEVDTGKIWQADRRGKLRKNRNV